MSEAILPLTKIDASRQKAAAPQERIGAVVVATQGRAKPMGRPPHEPTAETRRMVEQHAAVGTLHVQIAKLLKLSLNTMKKHYREELDLGLARANAVIASTLFAQAKGGNVVAAIFWMKTRGGWRETAKIEHGGAPGEPIELRRLDATRLSDGALAELLAARGHAPDRG